MAGPGFAVIDFETTGLFTARGDRVVELAVVHVDADGRIEGAWDTLVNPTRDLGPQRIHQIQAADIMNAPTFAQIAPALLELLAGRVLVAHNASFDLGFLMAELERCGYWVVADIASLCTMQLARDILPGSGRSLADCCAAYDIELDGAHRASVDAMATARLLAAYIETTNEPEFWYGHVTRGTAYSWLDATLSEKVLWYPRPTVAADLSAAGFLRRITTKLPEFAGPPQFLDYLALLDRCLIDRRLSAHEGESLVLLAETLGISRSSCERLHVEYFAALTTVAWADGILTSDEAADLLDVADLLALPTEMVSAALDAPPPAAATSDPTLAAVGAFSLAAGDRVVLTGEMVRPRDEWESELTAFGYVPWPSVTKKVRLVVAADPDSLSGKARKARDYGIPIVGESALARLLA